MNAVDAFGYHTSNQMIDIIGNFETVMNRGKKIEETPKRKADFHRGVKRCKRGITCFNVMGYIPLLGTMTAIGKICLYRRQIRPLFIVANELITKKEYTVGGAFQEGQLEAYEECVRQGKSYITGQKIRTAIEVTSLGFILIVPDIAVTIHRNL